MAPPTSRRKTLYYKRAYLVGAQTLKPTLASYLESALQKRALPMDRAERLGDSQDNVRVIARCYKLGTMICGRFLDFTEGGFQAVLDVDPNLDDIPVKFLAPKQKEQFLEGVLTFGVRENHVILIQSKGLRIRHLESHLNWFLGVHASVLPPGVHIALEDEIAREVRDLEDVEYVELRRPVGIDNFLHNPEQEPKGLTGSLVEYLKELRPTRGTALERLSAEAALKVNGVELTVRIKREGRARRGPSLMDEIAHVLRADDDVEIKVKTRTAEYTGEQLRLVTPRNVHTEPNGMPVLQSAAEVMQEWLADLLQQRRIDEFR